MSREFDHSSPRDVRDHHAFSRPGGAACGYEAHQIVRISVGIRGVAYLARRASAHKCFERWMAVAVSVDANEMKQTRDAPLYFTDRISKRAVVKKPGGLDVVHVLDVRVRGIPGINRDPDGASSQ